MTRPIKALSNLALPWRARNALVINVHRHQVVECEAADIADHIALSASHHIDLRNALRYILDRGKGCNSNADYWKLVPIIMDCASMALYRLQTHRPMLTDDITIDSNELTELIAERDRLKRAMLDAIRYIRMNGEDAAEELSIVLNCAYGAGISEDEIAEA